MPSPGAGETSGIEGDDGDQAGPSNLGDEVESQGESARQTQVGSVASWNRWTDEEWRQWNAYYTVTTWNGHAADSSVAPPSSSTTGNPGVDPWQQGVGDPWSKSEDHRGSGAAQDKIQVPEFSGEDDRDGGKAKSYLRKVEAWKRVTRLPMRKQALMLYNNWNP